ncbi:MAG: hypothetical protein IJS68_02795 [Clostridia bacterium]|nr:hypothetical protein [Clostridia bacterium]
MFDYIKTAYNLVVGLLTENVLIISSVVLLFLLFLWIVLSLAVCNELRIVKYSKKMFKLLEQARVNTDENPMLYELVGKMPEQFRRQFRIWQYKGGLPGDYFTQQVCVDTTIYSGLYRQNRTIMSWAIRVCVVLQLILSLGILSTESAITGLVLGQALIVPMLTCLLLEIEFFVYTSIRQYYYKLAVEKFNNLVDLLNEKYENGEIDFPNKGKAKCFDCEQNDYDFEDEDMIDDETKRGRGRPRKSAEEKEAEGRIENDADFARAISRAEKLMSRLHNKDLSDSQIRRTNKELGEIMAKMSEYKRRNK